MCFKWKSPVTGLLSVVELRFSARTESVDDQTLKAMMQVAKDVGLDPEMVKRSHAIDQAVVTCTHAHMYHRSKASRLLTTRTALIVPRWGKVARGDPRLRPSSPGQYPHRFELS